MRPAGPYLRAARPKVDIRRERDAAGQLTRIVISAPPGSVIEEMRCIVKFAPARLPRRRNEAKDRAGGGDDR